MCGKIAVKRAFLYTARAMETEGPERARFVWPPGPPTRVDAGGARGAASTSGGVEVASTAVARAPAAPARRGVVIDLEPVPESAWSAIERVWLAPTASGLFERAARARWTPDGPEEYCARCFASRVPGAAGRAAGKDGCASCEGRAIAWDHAVRLGEYVNPLDAWIKEVKFGRFRAVGTQLGEWLGECVAASMERAGEGDAREGGPVIVVPMPMTTLRRWVRGIDHAGVLAAGVARVLEAPVVRVLARSPRPSQREVATSERAANVRGVFRVTRAGRAAIERATGGLGGGGVGGERGGGMGIRWVLVDDVTTTGATLHAAARVLRAASGGGVGGRRGRASGGSAGGLPGERQPAGGKPTRGKGAAEGHRIWAAAAGWTPGWRRKEQEA